MTRQKYKIGVVAALVVGACSLTYYFHVFLTRGTFIAHVFYIPIVLASVWWRRKGLIVAVFSSAFLILSHVFLRPDVAVINDYSRAVMFLVISFVVGELSERIAKDKDVLESANEKLQAREQQVRAANQQLDAQNQQLRASEQEIREMEEDWRQSFNSLEDVMILINRDFTIEKINANGLKLLGKSHADAVGKKCYEVLHGLNAPSEGCPLKKSLKTKKVESIDRFDKDFRGYFSIKVSPVFDEKGGIIRFVDLMRDITARKRAEKDLQSAYEQLQASEQQLTAANQQLSATGQQLRATNHQLEADHKELRASEEELRKLSRRVHERAKKLECLYGLSQLDEQRNARLEQVIEGAVNLIPPAWRHPEITGARITFENLRFKTDNFQKTPWMQSAEIQVLGETVGTIEVCYRGESPEIDDEGPFLKEERMLLDGLAKHLGRIAERKRAQEELLAREQQLRAANQQLVATNAALVSSEQQLKAGNQQLSASEQHLRAANQQLRTEVAERRRVEEVLVKSEDRFRQLFDHMSSGVAVYEARDDGQDFVVVDFNRAGEQIEDLKRKDLIGKSVLDVFPGVKDFGLFDVFLKVWRTGEPKHYPISFYKDERIAGWRENYVYKLPSGEIVAVYDDITERKQAEEQLWRTRAELEHVSRLITAGEMASGIAHELNQPLCAILNYANALLRAIKGGRIKEDTLTVALEDIASQTNRAGEIIRRLRGLVKKRGPRRSSVDINEIVEEVIKLEQAEALEHGVVIETELADDIQFIMADNIQVEQVILNLVRNGFEAMAETPRQNRHLTIRTTALEGGRIEVAVCDSGKGLSEETVKRMFDSFFSTRDDGIGVGLSLSRSIIEAHGGRIWAEPNADCGATVRFVLPAEGA